MDPQQPQNMPQDPYRQAYPGPQPPQQPTNQPPYYAQQPEPTQQYYQQPQHQTHQQGHYQGHQQQPGGHNPSLASVNAQYDPAQPDQPVAYDQFGNPLYSHPAHQPQFVHLSRAIQPLQEEIPPEIMRRYDESLRKYPHLNLSKGEYVIRSVKRHPIGILRIWSIATLLILAFMALLLGFFMNQESTSSVVGDTGMFMTVGVAMLIGLSLMTVLGAFVATYVYNSNHFYLTSESVIQEIQTSLFSKHEQTVSLANIEDASYKQGGIVQSFFNYGTIRLSTEGDETTYLFTYVSNPKQHIATLNNAVEAFKNGRPVFVDED